jgi:hypothetical protein
MNKKGQAAAWSYGFMIGITLIVLALALAPTLKSFVDSAMGETTADFIGLDCDTTDNNFVKGVCVITDFSLFYFIAALLFIGVGFITARVVG